MAIDCISREIAMSMPWANGQYDHEHANEHFICGLETYKEWLEYVPAADVQLVVRGKWIVHTSDLFPADSTIECDQCHAEQPVGIDDNFCPNCGADMRGK